MGRLGLYLRLSVSLLGIAGRTLGAFRRHRLWPFVPIVLFLLMWSIVLWAINSVAPLAPFVYSLI